MYDRALALLTDAAVDPFAHSGNVQAYPNPPAFPDRSLVALAVAAEWVECDSENLLFAKLRTCYPDFAAGLPHRVNYNRRRKRLEPVIRRCLALASARIDDDGEDLVVDSMPIPTAVLRRESRSRACRRPGRDRVCADKGFVASGAGWMLGYKLHLICSTSGVYVDHDLLPASASDLRYVGQLAEAAEAGLLDGDLAARLLSRRCLADKAYDSRPHQLRLDDGLDLALSAPMRANRTDWRPYSRALARARKRVETTFSQCCDEVRMKVNRAKRFAGLEARVTTKLLARTLRQVVNYEQGRPIAQTKHALAT